MSTRFTFTSGASGVSLEDSPLQSADDDTESDVTYRDGKVDVDLSTDYTSHLNILGTLRYETDSGLSESGRYYDKSNEDAVKVSSMAGEGGLHPAYDEWVLDERIIEDGGDGGKDGELLLDGEIKTVDVKTTTSYGEDPWLKVKAPKFDRFRERGDEPDAFVLATYDDGTVTYHGWISSEDLCRPENRSDITGADNYVATDIGVGADVEALNDMPYIPTEFTFSA